MAASFRGRMPEKLHTDIDTALAKGFGKVEAAMGRKQ
jgi:hypothetical protein